MNSLNTSPHSTVQYYHYSICHGVTKQKSTPSEVPRGTMIKKEDLILFKLKQNKQGYTHPIFHYIEAINF